MFRSNIRLQVTYGVLTSVILNRGKVLSFHSNVVFSVFHIFSFVVQMKGLSK